MSSGAMLHLWPSTPWKRGGENDQGNPTVRGAPYSAAPSSGARAERRNARAMRADQGYGEYKDTENTWNHVSTCRCLILYSTGYRSRSP